MEVVIKPEIKQVLKQLNLSDDALLFLVACRLGLEVSIDDYIFSKLAAQKLIERDIIKDKYIVTVPIFEGEEGQVPHVISQDYINYIRNNVDQYRALFKGIRVRSMGDRSTVEDNLVRWLSLHPNYTLGDIIHIVSEYLSKADRTYIPNADNFIFSVDRNGKEISTLSAVVEEYSLGDFEKEFI